MIFITMIYVDYKVEHYSYHYDFVLTLFTSIIEVLKDWCILWLFLLAVVHKIFSGPDDFR
jgi:hypothetical protein